MKFMRGFPDGKFRRDGSTSCRAGLLRTLPDLRVLHNGRPEIGAAEWWRECFISSPTLAFIS